MIKLKSLLLEKDLYHGTIIDYIPSIEKYGLIPSVGEFVKHAYDMTDYPDDYLKELIFATDKEQLDKAVTAITAQISYKLNKSFHDVTDNEFIRYGAIVKVFDGSDYLLKKPFDNDREEYPHTVETGDYYFDESIKVDDILTGKQMIKFLKRYGVWPRLYNMGISLNPKLLKGELIRLALKYHKDKPKEKIINLVKSIKDNYKLIDYINHYRNLIKNEKK